jgi:hypothetical protein
VSQGESEAARNVPYALIKGIAQNSILISGRYGFIQENTVIRLPPTIAAPAAQATAPVPTAKP